MARPHDPETVRGAIPGWLEPAIAAAAVVIAVAATATAQPAHRPIVGLFLAVATVPFVAGLSARMSPPPWASVAIVLGALAVAQVGGAHWGWLGDDLDTQLALLLGILLVAEVCAVESIPMAVVTVVGLMAVLVGRQLHDTYLLGGIVWPGAVLFGVFVGILIRLLLRSLEDLEAAREQLAADAVRAERRRIARDVHDVVAHTMTVSMLHITAARMALDRGDETAATEALEEAERAGRASLRDVRSTVGLLRDDADSGLAPPQPGADDVDELVEAWRSAGLDIALRRDGDLGGVSDAVGMTVFRIVQESLANAGRHLPGATTSVTVARRGQAVEVVVSSTGSTPGPIGDGHGLVGMRERVAALGGRVEAGPRADGWSVEATVPLTVPKAATSSCSPSGPPPRRRVTT